MALERLFRTSRLIESPYLMTVYISIIVICSGLTAYAFFQKSTSILTIAFITIALTHLIYNILKMAEDQIDCECNTFFERYSVIIKTFLKIFGSLVFVFALLYIAIPQEFRLILFSEQINTLSSVSQIRDNITLSTNNTGYFLANGLSNASNNLWLYIFINNLEVLFASILLSFLYASGAIFLISYQASVVGVIIGQNIISLFGLYNNLGIYGQFFAFLHGSYLSLGILPHGIFEFGAYFLGAIAGGIITATFFGKYSSNERNLINTAKDVVILIVIALLFLIIGAIIESFLVIA